MKDIILKKNISIFGYKYQKGGKIIDQGELLFCFYEDPITLSCFQTPIISPIIIKKRYAKRYAKTYTKQEIIQIIKKQNK